MCNKYLKSQSIIVSGFLVLFRDGMEEDHTKVNKSQFLETYNHSCIVACSGIIHLQVMDLTVGKDRIMYGSSQTRNPKIKMWLLFL